MASGRVFNPGQSGLVLITAAGFSLLSVMVSANTSSVFSPDVDAGSLETEFRASYVPSESGSGSAYNQRLHLQYGFNESWRARIIASQTRSNGEGLEYNYTRLEVQQQLVEHQQAGWDSALRYGLQIANGAGRPDRFRIAWTGKLDLESGWQLRSNALVGRQFGDNSGSGLQVETRFQLSRALTGGGRLGVEMFNDLNRTTGFGSFDEQQHQIGPIYKFDVGAVSVNAGVLFGVSDAAEDQNFRLHVILPL